MTGSLKTSDLPSERSRGVTLVLAALLRPFGAHRFYVGKTGTGPRLDTVTAEVFEELSALRSEVAELAERLDFAERLLAQPRPDAGQSFPHQPA